MVELEQAFFSVRGVNSNMAKQVVNIGTVSTESFIMDYMQFGSGGKTLVILPGLSVQSVMGAADAVASAYEMLTREYTIYLFDRRRDPPVGYSISQMAADTAAAVKALGLERVSVFGASQGGMIAMELAIDFPHLVDKLILGSTSCCVSDEDFMPIAERISLAQKGDAEALYLSFGRSVYPNSVFEQSRSFFTEAAKSVTADELKHFIILAESLRGFDISKRLDALNCSVLIIGDNDDRVLGGNASSKLAEYVVNSPKCELFTYNGYGHAAYDTAPDYKERMLSFLES